MTARISISEARWLAGERDEGDPLRDAFVNLIEAAESLKRVHDDDCGCDEPAGVECVWPLRDAQLLARFDFDEEIEWP